MPALNWAYNGVLIPVTFLVLAQIDMYVGNTCGVVGHTE